MTEEMQSSLPVAKKYFGETARIYDVARQTKEETHQDQFVIENALRAFVGQGSQVLDIACGTNRISKLIRNLGGRYHGIDISADMVALAREKEPESDIRVADARDIPHPAGKFDLVMTIKFLKWLPDDAVLQQVLTEISRVLRPNGIALLHQQIQVVSPLRRSKGIRAMLGALVKAPFARGQTDDDLIKTRAADESTFLGLCREAGLDAKCNMLISPVTVAATKKRVNVFYVLQKRA
jgi:ubiquinone/menaquinone biosynthesis C-methylase UbiE